ncbi:hypothetical protein [Ruminococcus sp.]|uniref:hypothetical protein n=1 Tax=Ruminococcus sp. TaxID=41978 RepID=UPI0025E50241|nr:hypothetical protein [Ruminococcus sp.]
MFFPDMLTSIAKISDAENPTIFPFPSWMLIGVAVLSLIFFGYRFAVQKKPFQLIFAIAPLIALLLLFTESKTVFYGVGIVEFILILTAFISSLICKPKKAEEKAAQTVSGKED